MRARTIAGLLVVIAVGIVCAGYAPRISAARPPTSRHTARACSPAFTRATSPSSRRHATTAWVTSRRTAARPSTTQSCSTASSRSTTVATRSRATTTTFSTRAARPPTRSSAGSGSASRTAARSADSSPRPYILYPLLALVIGGAASGFFVRKRRRHSGAYDRQPARPSARGPGRLNPADGRRLRVVVPIAAAVTALAFLIAAVAAFGSPRSEQTTRRETYAQHLTVGYHAKAAVGAAYPDGKVDPGEPIFTRLVRNVDIALDYDLRADTTPRRVHGTYQVMANLSNAQRLVAVDPAHPEPRVLGNPFRRPRAAASRRVARPRAALLRRDGTAVQPGDDQHRAARRRHTASSRQRRSRAT